MTGNVLALFKDRAAAEAAVQTLLDAGYGKEDIGMVGPDSAQPEGMTGRLAAGAVGGTVAGGVAGGVLAAAAVGLIPGVGPLLAAGTLLPVLTGTATAAATGGVAGSLIAMAGHTDRALYFEQQVEAGSWLVSVATADRTATTELLLANGAFGIPPPEPPAPADSSETR